MEDRQIDIKNCFYSIIAKWRSILIATVAIAALFTGLMYAKNVRNYNASQAIAENSDKTDSIELTDAEQQSVDYILDKEDELKYYEDYQQSSVYMQIDPSNEEKVTLQFLVSGDTMNVMESLRAYITSQGLAQVVAADMGDKIESKYLAELISFSTLDVSQRNDGYIISSEAYEENRVFVINVIGVEAGPVSLLADAVEKSVNVYVEGKADLFGGSSIQLLDRIQTVVTDSNLMSSKSSITSTISNLSTDIATQKAALSENQLAVLENHGKTTDKQEVEQVSTIAKPSISAKYIVVGLVLGVFVMCCFYGLKYIMSGRIKCAEEIYDAYHFPLLGRIVVDTKKSPVDRFIQKIDVPVVKTVDEQIQSIQQLLTYQCKGHEVDKIALVSTSDMKGLDADNIRSIEESLSTRGLDMIFVDHFFTNGDALEKLTDYRNVVLVEKLGISQTSEISKAVEMIRGMDQNILGYIVL